MLHQGLKSGGHAKRLHQPCRNGDSYHTRVSKVETKALNVALSALTCVSTKYDVALEHSRKRGSAFIAFHYIQRCPESFSDEGGRGSEVSKGTLAGTSVIECKGSPWPKGANNAVALSASAPISVASMGTSAHGGTLVHRTAVSPDRLP